MEILARRCSALLTLRFLMVAVMLTGVGLTGIGLSGCVSTMPNTGASGTSYGGGYTSAEQDLRQQSQLFSRTSMQGCVAGAAAGALLGLLVDSMQQDDRKNSRRNKVLIGAAGGCAAGMAANVYVQNKRNQYYSSEARINAMIAEVRADNQRLSNLVATTRDVIADDRRRIAEVDRQYRDKQISAAEARAQLARVKENRRLLDNTIGGAREKEANWREIAAIEKRDGAQTARLTTEINQYKKQLATLEAEAALIDREIAASPAAA